MQKLSEHPSYACCSHTAPTKAETHHAYKIQSTVSKRHRTHYNTRHKTLTNTHGTRAPTVTGKLHPTLYAETDIPEGEVEEAQYPGGRYYAEVLELKKLSAYASDATVSKPCSIINNAHIFTNTRLHALHKTGTFHEPFQVFEHRLLPRSTIYVQPQARWLL